MHGLKAPKPGEFSLDPLAEVDTRLLCTGEESENFPQNTWKTALKKASKRNDNFSELFLKVKLQKTFCAKRFHFWKVLDVTSTFC